MARFCARVYNEDIVKSYVLRYNSAMNSAKGRFMSGEMFVIPDKEFSFVFAEFNILIVKFWYITLLALVGSFFIWGFGVHSVVLGLLSCSAYFWTPFFARWLFKRGLRKTGYKGEVLFYG